MILSSIFSKIPNFNIIKVFSFTSLSTLIKMLTGLIVVKVIAVIIGPSGVALLGQLNSFSVIILNFATGGINSGVTKYIAENNRLGNNLSPFISTAFKITLLSSLVVGILMILFHKVLATFILLSMDFSYIFIIFGITIIFYALNNLLLSIINGHKDFRKFIFINILNSCVGLIFTVVLVLVLDLEGALVAAVTYQSVMFFVTLALLLKKSNWINKNIFFDKFNKTIAKKYFHYTLMSIITVSAAPISQLILRRYIISNISDVEAGWWEAMNRISGMYLTIITSSFSIYYLPRLSELLHRDELRKEIFTAYRIIIPILLIALIVIYCIRGFIINILFTPDFSPMKNLFLWQLIGDLFKISSWLLSYLMLAKSMTKDYLITEIISACFFLSLAFVFIHYNGVVGVTQAYMINYISYFIILIAIFRKTIFNYSK